jgi:lipopolysaccharide/colanic/teichoic acid biosynthesis glycosyltransferase
MIPLHGNADEDNAVDVVLADFRSDMPDEWERRMADYALRGIPVLHYKHFKESLTGRVELEHLSENTFGQLAPISAYMTVRHAMDWLVALVALVVLSPLLLIVAVLVKLESPGPALFRQVRIGYRGERFTVIKFRTMKVAAGRNDALQAAKTQADDDRITRLGRFLRTSRLDELPQIFNILRGQMSWIGPRPEAEVLSIWYEKDIPFYRYRHIVRPGITGWAQVCQGHVTELEEVRHKLYYDFFFIKYYSFWLDLVIVLRTIKTMVTGYGAR